MLSPAASELLDKAIERLMDDGWTQGRFIERKPEGGFCYCMAGALMKEAGGQLIDQGGELYTLIVGDSFELQAYREVMQAYEHTFGVTLFRANDEAEDMDDIVTQLMWLQVSHG